MFIASLVPRPGFSHLRMRFIAVEFPSEYYGYTYARDAYIGTSGFIVAAYGMQRNSLDFIHPAADMTEYVGLCGVG